MNVSLTPRLEAYVRDLVASGLYNNASEVVREALRHSLERQGDADRLRSAVAPTRASIVERVRRLEPDLRARGVTAAELVGSVARDAARARSDVDLVIDVAADEPFSLLALARLKEDLEAELGRPVDVVMRRALPAGVCAAMERDAVPIFG